MLSRTTPGLKLKHKDKRSPPLKLRKWENFLVELRSEHKLSWNAIEEITGINSKSLNEKCRKAKSLENVKHIKGNNFSSLSSGVQAAIIERVALIKAQINSNPTLNSPTKHSRIPSKILEENFEAISALVKLSEHSAPNTQVDLTTDTPPSTTTTTTSYDSDYDSDSDSYLAKKQQIKPKKSYNSVDWTKWTGVLIELKLRRNVILEDIADITGIPIKDLRDRCRTFPPETQTHTMEIRFADLPAQDQIRVKQLVERLKAIPY